MGEFDGRTVLVTGGGDGLGLATARRLVAAGANIVLVGGSGNRLARALTEIGSCDRVLAVPADVSRPADLDALMHQVRLRFGRLDGVFTNTEAGRSARLADITEADFDRIVATNLKGVFFTVQRALPLLGYGASVVLNALPDSGPAAPAPLYAALTAAVRQLATSLAPELAPRGIMLTCITPGLANGRTRVPEAVCHLLASHASYLAPRPASPAG
jgi:NAD(P)-dependent dehydrogenase (short-subunit alcohol dehydrogenase family)